MHAFPEGFRTEVVLDGEQYVAALAVGDAVEHLLDLFARVRPGPNGASGWLRIEPESAVLAAGYQLIDIPLRMHGGYGLVLHPVSKAFVEPGVVPPLHGHEVTEPLVSHLMGDHQRDFFLSSDGPCFGVDQH